MIKRKTYTALCLFGIFVFPMVFQTVHRIEHHKPTGHTCCEQHGCYETSDTQASDAACTVGEDAHCLICEYDLFLKSISAVFSPCFISIETHYSYSNPDFLPYKHIALLGKAPRAPPAERI